MERVLVAGGGRIHRTPSDEPPGRAGVLGSGDRPPARQSQGDAFEILDLRRWDACLVASRGVEEVYALAANIGGIGFVHSHKAEISRDNILVDSLAGGPPPQRGPARCLRHVVGRSSIPGTGRTRRT